MSEQTQGFNASREAFGSGMQSFAGRGPKGHNRSDTRSKISGERVTGQDDRSQSADQRLKNDVCDRLTDEAWLDASEIEVTVRHCAVTLAGTVCDSDQQRRAEDVAEATIGVKSVTNELRIANSQGIDRASQDPM